MDREERKAFVRAHRTCVFGYNRRHDGPSMSIVYYLMEGPDDLLIPPWQSARRRKRSAAVPRYRFWCSTKNGLQLKCSRTVTPTLMRQWSLIPPALSIR
jgi:hypothetical protein